MKKAIEATHQEFESSCYRTPQYLAWHRLFKKEFTKFLTSKGATVIEIGKPNHFDMSGFFTLGHKIWYFSISDLRGFKDSMLIRVAKYYKDYTGGMNQYAPLSTPEKFEFYFDQVVAKGDIKPIHHCLVDNINQANRDYLAMLNG